MYAKDERITTTAKDISNVNKEVLNLRGTLYESDQVPPMIADSDSEADIDLDIELAKVKSSRKSRLLLEPACQSQGPSTSEPAVAENARTNDGVKQGLRHRNISITTEISNQGYGSTTSKHSCVNTSVDAITTTSSATIPLRAARVHKPRRVSRQLSRNMLSDYTAQLIYLEAVSNKHLKDTCG